MLRDKALRKVTLVLLKDALFNAFLFHGTYKIIKKIFI